MQWSDVLRDQSLQDLPYKVELNEWGQIILSPASNRHGKYQYKIARIIEKHLGTGEIITECSIETDAGVKVADVAWCSGDFLRKHGIETPFTEAPEICVEILSPSNSEQQMKQKLDLYFQRHAKECWLVSEEGDVRFFNHEGEREESSFGFKVSSVNRLVK